MKKYLVLVPLIMMLVNACKEEQKCCCTNISIMIPIAIKDTSIPKSIDTGFIKANNELSSFVYSDSIIMLQIQANIDPTEDDKIVNTTKYFNISPIDTDTIITAISGTCGRQISKVWYNGELKYSAAFSTTGLTIFVIK